MVPRAAFLDFDGLICDTERAARRSWEELYDDLGFAFPPALWGEMVGRASGEVVALADLARRLGRNVNPEERLWRQRRKHELSQREPLCHGVTELLATASQLGVTVGVVSSSPESWVGPHLTRLGVRDRVSFLITGDRVARHKPAPDLYLVALRKADVEPSAALAFEDSASGVRAARAAGLRCVGIPSSVGRFEDVAAADVVLESLAYFDFAMQEVARR